VLGLFVDRMTDEPAYPFLPAFAAIIASGACAGAGPGVISTAILVAWAAFDLRAHNRAPANIVSRSLIFLVEGLFLSIGSARMWRSKREMDRSEAWHRRLVETAAEGIWVRDGNGIITYANARMAEIVGLSVDELVGRKVDEFFLPADLSVERIRAENIRCGRKEQFDRRLRRSDGAEIWVLTCCNLIDGDESESPAVLAMMTDITERKRAEHALRRSEERFRNLFETVLEGVYRSTPDGRILAGNPMLFKMLGLANESELAGINIAQDLYVDPHVRQHLIERLEHEGRLENVEYELRRRDGGIITVLENARVERDDTGAVLYYEGTLTDITPRKRIEEQLRQAQKVEALGRLAGGIAHDFNNILTVITGYSQLVLSELDPAHAAHPSAIQVQQAARSATALTKQLLSFSRRQSPIQGSVDLNRAIERAQPALHLLLTDRVDGHKAGLVLSLCQEPAPVYIGQTQIELIVLSLTACLRNAAPIDNLGLKTELVHLDEEICERGGDVQPGLYAVLVIWGLQAGDARDRNTTSLFANPDFAAMDAGESAAMGLSSTHAIVAQRGGFVAVDHNFHLAFHVFLPCALAPLDGETLQTAGAEAGGETILLVEDEPLVRELSRDMLERQGYRVVLAADAKEAERMSANAGSFDLLITDAVMPSITGVELARRIRASHPGLKVLFISGYTNEPAETGGEGAAFLQKPFSADSLGRKIRQILNRP
jgi:two-component system, cell cycle sensor histidine kinase and response regulator CckA